MREKKTARPLPRTSLESRLGEDKTLDKAIEPPELNRTKLNRRKQERIVKENKELV